MEPTDPTSGPPRPGRHARPQPGPVRVPGPPPVPCHAPVCLISRLPGSPLICDEGRTCPAPRIPEQARWPG